MDKKPFFVFDLQSFDEKQVAELSRFQKSDFDVENILEAASNLKWVKAAASYLSRQMGEPEDDFVRLVGKQIYEGSITKAVLEQLRPAIQAALDEVVRNRIQEKLNVTFAKEAPALEAATSERRGAEDPKNESEIVTTDEEMLAFMIVRAIGARAASVDRITMRDAKSYCSVFVDDNNRKPVCRFYFNAKNSKSVGIFSASKEEERHTISDLNDLYRFTEEIQATISSYVA